MMRKQYKIDLSVDDDFEPKKKKKLQPKKSCILPQETTMPCYSNQQRQLDVKDTKLRGNIPHFTQIPDTIAEDTSVIPETFA